MTIHKYPAVLPPQEQETIHDIVDQLQRYLEQREISHQEKQRQIDQLSASLNAERKAHEETKRERDHLLVERDISDMMHDAEKQDAVEWKAQCMDVMREREQLRAALLAAVAEAERANARADAAGRRLALADAASGVDDN